MATQDIRPVIIVGAGLAGLTCAEVLRRAGRRVIVLESDTAPGGRLQTDVVRGFKVDRGFQVYLPAYPHASQWLDHVALRLRPWRRGAKIWLGDGWATIDAARPIATAMSPVFSLVDKLRSQRLLYTANALSPRDRARFDDRTAEQYLRDYGFSDAFLDRFIRPFFGGIFLDPTLQTSAAQFLFVYGMLGRGGAAVPEGGIAAIPHQLATGLPDVRFSQRVTGIRPDAVHLADGSSLRAGRVVLAAGPLADEAMLGQPVIAGWNRSCAYLFAAPREVEREPMIVLNGSGSGVINEVAPLSRVDRTLAPNGGALVSATVVNRPPPGEAAIRAELRAMYPGAGVDDWMLLRVDDIPHAQMTQPPGFMASRPSVRDVSGVFRAGDYTQNASIDGAIESGVQAAQAVLRCRD
ncbi:MAG: NAD(P)/FAD-dependent oxidoreductase [Fimbriimonadaceae bacterium]|nr:NAD(P)/FAD-dependent oxidoreductase [Fimbriimonadaceae bacterium]